VVFSVTCCGRTTDPTVHHPASVEGVMGDKGRFSRNLHLRFVSASIQGGAVCWGSLVRARDYSSVGGTSCDTIARCGLGLLVGGCGAVRKNSGFLDVFLSCPQLSVVPRDVVGFGDRWGDSDRGWDGCVPGGGGKQRY
jgi:hypothetical protein